MPAISARQIGTHGSAMIGVAAHEQPISRLHGRECPGRPQYHARCLERGAAPDLDPPALRLAAGGRAGRVYLGAGGGRATPADIPHTAPVRLEICLLNIGGSPEQEWPVQVLTQDEWETQVWFKDLAKRLRRGGLPGGYAALQRAARLSGAVSGDTPSCCCPGRRTAPMRRGMRCWSGPRGTSGRLSITWPGVGAAVRGRALAPGDADRGGEQAGVVPDQTGDRAAVGQSTAAGGGVRAWL